MVEAVAVLAVVLAVATVVVVVVVVSVLAVAVAVAAVIVIVIVVCYSKWIRDFVILRQEPRLGAFCNRALLSLIVPKWKEAPGERKILRNRSFTTELFVKYF